MRYLKLWMQYVAIQLAKDMAYKTNFFIKVLSLIIADVIGPIITILLYANTAGIPGWTFEEFILFQGTFILVFGLGHLLFFGVPFEVVHMVREGEFNKILIAPINPLMNVSFRSFDLEGFAEVITGMVLIMWALFRVDFVLMGMIAYVILIVAAVLFMYSVFVIISSISFIVVKTYALIDLFFKTSDIARYPASIYGSALRFFVSFLFPIAIAAYYPSMSLLRGVSWPWMIQVLAPVTAFFIFALIIWEVGMKRYTASGG
ncbi:MAG: ABC-2 family transporter protein [Nanoarchaeota archaeon]|nr:ABC-2 family transporter protein [Nanoarchaeota archaeon]